MVKIYGGYIEASSIDTLKLNMLEVVKDHAKELFNDEAHAAFQEATVSHSFWYSRWMK